MGRGTAASGNNLLYGSTRTLRTSAPSGAELDETLMRIAYQIRDDEFWDDTITPHDIRRKYSRYDESPRQQEVHLQRVVSTFRSLEAEGMIELDHVGEEPAWHHYRLTARGQGLGDRLVEDDYRAARERVENLDIDDLLTAIEEPDTPELSPSNAEELRRRGSGPEGVSPL